MLDEHKTKEQLITEIRELRERLAESEKDKAEREQTERALSESRQMLQLVLDTIPVRVFWKNLHSEYLGCNLPFALDAGLQSPSEIIGKNDFQMGWAEYAELYRSDDRWVMVTGRPKLGYEEPQTTTDGSSMWLRTNKVPLLDVESRIRGVLGTYEDITESKRMQETLRLSETRYRIVADNTYDWEYWANPEGRFLYTSPSCSRITGYTANDFEVDPDLFSRILHPDDLAQFQAHLEEDMSPAGNGCLEFRIIHRDGSTRWIGHVCQPAYDAQGVFLGRRGSNRDITERKQVEEALRESEERYRTIVETAMEGIWVLDSSGKTSFVNHRMAAMLGYTMEEMHGRDLLEFVDKTDRPDAGRHFEERRRGGGGEQQDFHFSGKDGRDIWAIVAGNPLFDTQGRVKGSLAMVTDITQRKIMEDAIRESSEKIKLFAYTVCHDLKSPSIALYGLTKRLQRLYADVLDEKGSHYCDQILKASEQIASLVESINQFIVTKESPLTFETLNLREILEVLRDEFATQLNLRQITWAIPDKMPEFKADRLSILRVIRNLVENALKYGGDDLREIRIGYEESQDHHVISVANDGAGIGNEDSERIFMPFNRAKGVLEVRGAGLGLAIVKEIAENHGGMAWFKPISMEKGCTFYVSISKIL